MKRLNSLSLLFISRKREVRCKHFKRAKPHECFAFSVVSIGLPLIPQSNRTGTWTLVDGTKKHPEPCNLLDPWRRRTGHLV